MLLTKGLDNVDVRLLYLKSTLKIEPPPCPRESATKINPLSEGPPKPLRSR